MSLAPGRTLSCYEILAPLGAGGMGEVYRARDTRLEREVAIKVLPEELAGDEERLRRGAGLLGLARDDYAGAAEHFRRAAGDGAWVGHYGLAWALSGLGEHERALAEIELARRDASGALARELGLESTVLAFRALAGDEEGARAELAQRRDSTDAAFARGLAHAVLKDVDRAFELWLNQTEWTIQLPTLFRYGPMLDAIRDDPRYARVLARIDEQWGW